MLLTFTGWALMSASKDAAPPVTLTPATEPDIDLAHCPDRDPDPDPDPGMDVEPELGVLPNKDTVWVLPVGLLRVYDTVLLPPGLKNLDSSVFGCCFFFCQRA